MPRSVQRQFTFRPGYLRTLVWWACTIVALHGWGRLPAASIVINEVFYHAPDDPKEMQWIELFNAGNEPADLSGWSFVKGVSFVFPPATLLASGEFIVVVRDMDAFQRNHPGVRPAGEFKGQLRRKGERIELQDARGEIVDSIRYDNRDEWPRSPDGFGASLERICPTEPGDRPGNWESSARARSGSMGTPGKTNSVWRTSVPPSFSTVSAPPSELTAHRPLNFELEFSDPAGSLAGAAHYEHISLAGTSVSGQSPLTERPDRRWTTTLPGAPPGTLMRIWFSVTNHDGNTRRWPASNEPRPTLSVFIPDSTPADTHPLVRVVRRPGAPWNSGTETTAVIIRNEGTGEYRVFDHVAIRRDAEGDRIQFHRDRPYRGWTSALLTQGRGVRHILGEYVALEVHRRLGLSAPESIFTGYSVDNATPEWKWMVEDVDAGFLKRVGLDGGTTLHMPEGRTQNADPAKVRRAQLAWEEGRSALQASARQPAVQWEIIRKRFLTDEWITYVAVHSLLASSAGLSHHHLHFPDDATGLCRVVPIGFHPGSEEAGEGSTVDAPVTLLKFNTNSVPSSVCEWLISNPYFCTHLDARIRQLLATTFAEKTLQKWLEDARASLDACGPAAPRETKETQESLAELLKVGLNRRKHLSDQPEIRNAPAFDRRQLRPPGK